MTFFFCQAEFYRSVVSITFGFIFGFIDKRLDPSLTMEFTAEDAIALVSMSAQVLETQCLLEERSAQLMRQKALLKQDIDTFKKEIRNPLLWEPVEPCFMEHVVSGAHFRLAAIA